MTKELLVYSAILLTSVLISSVSQILLKISASRSYPSKIREYLNPYVVIGYALFFGCTFIHMIALKVVPLSTSPVLEAMGYVFVSVFSYAFLKEKMNLKQVLGLVLIVIGVAVCSL